MIEVHGTSLEPKDLPGTAQFTRLIASKTAPVFEAEIEAEKHLLSEVVAVTYRNEDGKPVHGGLFGFGDKGVVSITLKSLDNSVDTSVDPAHIAFGLIMMRGPLIFRQKEIDQEMALSIIDIQVGKLQEPLPKSTPVREMVKRTYLATL